MRREYLQHDSSCMQVLISSLAFSRSHFYFIELVPEWRFTTGFTPKLSPKTNACNPPPKGSYPHQYSSLRPTIAQQETLLEARNIYWWEPKLLVTTIPSFIPSSSPESPFVGPSAVVEMPCSSEFKRSVFDPR